MIGVFSLYRTTIGRKVIMAVTGLIGIGFVLGHMYGNLKMFNGPTYINEYAEGLRTVGAPIFGHEHLLWAVRIVLLIAVVLHVWSAWSLYQDAERARATKYVVHKKVQATLASLYMRVGGALLLVFLIYHLAHMTWGIPVIHPNFIAGDVYHNLVVGFRSYFYLPAIFYLAAMVALGFHLYHGVWSLFQTLGFNNQVYTRPLRMASLALSIVVAAGFAIVPLAIIFGFVR